MNQLETLRTWYRGPVPPNKSTPLDLVMIQGTRFCNIDCRYCYLPDRADKSTFDIALLDDLIPRLMASGLVAGTLPMLWHAGEPTVLKPDWYRAAFERIRDLVNDPEVVIEHHFQTNAMLINDAWLAFFDEWDVRVGVSMDGPAEIHDASRMTRDGRGTHARALAGLRKLQGAGLKPSVICVLSADSLSRPDEIYDFFRAEGVGNLGFNVEEKEGPHTRSTLVGGDAVAAYRRFLKRIVARATIDGFAMQIREFMRPRMAAFSPAAERTAVSSEAQAFSILSVDVEGRLFTWSPELVDLKDAQGRDYSIGHVSTLDFQTIQDGERFRELNGEIEGGVQACAATCGFFKSCGGGTPVNKLSENGSFNSTETLFCQLTRQVATEVYEDELVAIIERRRKLRRRDLLAPVRAAVPPASPAAEASPAAGTVMRPGVALTGEAARSGRVHLSPLVPVVGEDDLYHSGALVPTGEWRDPTPAEMAVLTTRELTAGPLAFITVVTPPAEMSRPFLELVADLPPDLSREEVRRRLTQAGVQDVMAAIGELYGRNEIDETKPVGVAVSPAGLRTSTLERDGRHIGLHVDSWYRQAIEDRASAPNRLCLNLGREPRHFLFWPVTVTRMAQMLGPVPGMTTRNVTGHFYNRYPGWPVARLTVRPGEAYIAPTELIPHDATTRERQGLDVSATLLGRFRPQPLKIVAKPGAARERA